ncbi:MAG: hypothetical protein ABEN55_17220 [Bradymonadaceae bacterium]
MMQFDEVTIQRTAAALAAAALCLVLPRLAHADLSHEALWGGPDLVSCMGPTGGNTDRMDRRQGPSTGETNASLAAECLDAAPQQSEKSNNLCFEKAGVPASVVPALAAKAKALDQTDALVDRARELIGWSQDTSTDRRVASRTHPIGVAPPSQPDRNDSCTARPESCRSLPPIPPNLSVDATATAPPLTSELPEIPAADRRDDDQIPDSASPTRRDTARPR